jgi:RNA-binding protein YlmH
MDIYQHFREEERSFIDQVLSWKNEVEIYYQRKLSDFLDPREQFIFSSIIGNNSDLQLEFFGGNEYAERKRAVLAPFYEQITEVYFDLTLLQGTYPSKFVQLTHRDILGSLMSLGVKRSKIGDILLDNGKFQIIADSKMADYIQMNLTQIKRSQVQLTKENFENIISKKETWIEKHCITSSLRLDTMIKEIYNISRQKAVECITKGAIKVNFQVVDYPSFTIEEGDMISFQKKGRSKIVKIEGKTKKEKWRTVVAMLK